MTTQIHVQDAAPTVTKEFEKAAEIEAAAPVLCSQMAPPKCSVCAKPAEYGVIFELPEGRTVICGTCHVRGQKWAAEQAFVEHLNAKLDAARRADEWARKVGGVERVFDQYSAGPAGPAGPIGAQGPSGPPGDPGPGDLAAMPDAEYWEKLRQAIVGGGPGPMVYTIQAAGDDGDNDVGGDVPPDEPKKAETWRDRPPLF